MDNVENSLAEFDALKEKAEALGIRIKSTATCASLKEAIAKKTKEVPGSEPEKEPEDKPIESVSQRRTRIQKKLALKRVTITCMNPIKRQAEGDFFAVANKYIGNVRRYIPFGVPWHVEECLLDFIKSKKYNDRSSYYDDKGKIRVDTKTYPEYQIQELPPLTKEELQDLANLQQMKQNMEEKNLI